VAPTLLGVIIMHEGVTGLSGAICFLAALRWLWLLPDWLAKWHSLVVYRRRLYRRGPGRGHATHGARER